MVTERIARSRSRAAPLHLVGVPYHWGGVGHRHGRLGQRAAAARARQQRAHQRVQGVRRATSGRAAARAARLGSSWSSEYRRRAGVEDVKLETSHVAGGATASERQAPDGLLHRHLGLHRLQGVRGRVQGVEPASRATARRLHRQVLRQHGRRSAPTPGGTSRSSSSGAGRRRATAHRWWRRPQRGAAIDGGPRPIRRATACAG